jgi:hypothetical protein
MVACCPIPIWQFPYQVSSLNQKTHGCQLSSYLVPKVPNGPAFGFGFCPLKAKSQPKGWIQEAAFSKSRLSRSAKLKAPMEL